MLGDSLSAAHNIPVESGWVALLQNRLNEQKPAFLVVNGSESGDTTSNGLSRLPSLLDANKPDIVLIELGANDGLRGLPLTVMKQNLQKIINLVKDKQGVPVLIAINLPPNYGPDYTLQFQQVFQQLSADNHIALVPSLLHGIEENIKNFQSDGIHPIASVEPILLNNVWAILKPML